MDEQLHQDKVLSANIKVHSFLAESGEYEKSPHFRPENKDKVQRIITKLVDKLDSNHAMLDLGCGTGFMLSLCHPFFEKLCGVDITDEMMKKVDLSSGKVELHNSLAEKTPFENDSFEMVTAYSFLDHLADYTSVIKEAYRVLKPGGIFYSDLNPNRAFIDEMESLSQRYALNELSPLLKREITGALHNGEHYQKLFGLDAQVLEDAEPGKTYSKGFDASEVKRLAEDIGFRDVEIQFEWFVNQGLWVNEKASGTSDTIEAYLQSLLPSTARYYKYLRFIFVK